MAFVHSFSDARVLKSNVTFSAHALLPAIRAHSRRNDLNNKLSFLIIKTFLVINLMVNISIQMFPI